MEIATRAVRSARTSIAWNYYGESEAAIALSYARSLEIQKSSLESRVAELEKPSPRPYLTFRPPTAAEFQKMVPTDH